MPEPGADEGIPVPAVTTDQRREADRIAVEATGPARLQMMENAGRSLAELAWQERGYADPADLVQAWALEAHDRLQGQRRSVRRQMSAHGDSA
jgi:hypothetical protein